MCLGAFPTMSTIIMCQVSSAHYEMLTPFCGFNLRSSLIHSLHVEDSLLCKERNKEREINRLHKKWVCLIPMVFIGLGNSNESWNVVMM